MTNRAARCRADQPAIRPAAIAFRPSKRPVFRHSAQNTVQSGLLVFVSIRAAFRNLRRALSRRKLRRLRSRNEWGRVRRRVVPIWDNYAGVLVQRLDELERG